MVLINQSMAAPMLPVRLLSASVGKVERELELTNPAKVISLIVLNFEEKVREHHFMRLKYVCLGKTKNQFVRNKQGIS